MWVKSEITLSAFSCLKVLYATLNCLTPHIPDERESVLAACCPSTAAFLGDV